MKPHDNYPPAVLELSFKFHMQAIAASFCTRSGSGHDLRPHSLNNAGAEPKAQRDTLVLSGDCQKLFETCLGH